MAVWTAHRRDKHKADHTALHQVGEAEYRRAGYHSRKTDTRQDRGVILKRRETTAEGTKSRGEQNKHLGPESNVFPVGVVSADSAGRKGESFTFCLNGSQEQGRAQGGQRWGKPGPHACSPSSGTHEGICGRKQ